MRFEDAAAVHVGYCNKESLKGWFMALFSSDPQKPTKRRWMGLP